MWILIVIIIGTSSSHPPQLTMQEFTSELRCNAAAEAVVNNMVNHPIWRGAPDGRAARTSSVSCVAR